MNASSSKLPYPEHFARDVYRRFFKKYSRATEITAQISHHTILSVLEWIRMNDPRWRMYKNCAKIVDAALIIDPRLVYEDDETLVKYFRAIFTAEEIANCPSSQAKGLTIEDHARNILEKRSRRGAWSEQSE